MLTPGQQLSLQIEKPAVGGRMIARADGQVVLVSGAIPGELATVRIERVGKGVAYGEAVAILEASPDRRQTAADPACGGCLYAAVAYPRQLTLKAQVVADALTRIGRIPWSAPIAVVPSPERGYRMRARVHYRDRRLGWFREGSHDLCDIRTTAQLLSESSDALDRLARGLEALDMAQDLEIELSENAAGSERVVHLEGTRALEPSALLLLAKDAALTGFTVAAPLVGGPSHAQVVSGDPRVRDVLSLGAHRVSLARHVLAFFQGNRFLLAALAAHVVEAVGQGEQVVDLYAGAGLFALSAAAVKGARVIAVEGDLVSSADLLLNAEALGGAVEAVHQSVETFTARTRPKPGTVILDPPRTGMSKEALRGVIALGAAQIVYVSCDVATFARDARGLVDAGYALTRLDAFDLFPNTPHVETVAAFTRT